MKLKKRHFEVAKTISWFVDRTDSVDGFPDFTEPTRQQIDLFTRVETNGKRSITEEEYKLILPLREGKAAYDLTIKNLYDEILDWVCQDWGWWYPIAHTIKTAWPERKQLRVFIKALVKIMRALQENSLQTLLSYSKFSPEQKQRLVNARY